MGDFHITLVPDNIINQKPEELATKLIAYFQQRKIIQSESTNIFGGLGYKPDINFIEILKPKYDPNWISIDGLQVRVGRQVFDNGENGVETVQCPDCLFDIAKANWVDYVEEWYSNSGKDLITCRKCLQVNSITDYIFNPTWAFGNVGFTFWNCPDFKDSFIKEISELTNSTFKIVYGKI